MATQAGNSEERRAALKMLPRLRRGKAATLGADKSYQEEGFVRELRAEQVVPHVAEYSPNPKWARANWLTERERNEAGYTISQRKRKLVEKVFGWMKQGRLRQVKVRGLRRVDWLFQLDATAHNLLRTTRLDPLQAQA